MVPKMSLRAKIQKIRILNLEYVLRGVGILLTMGILEHSPLHMMLYTGTLTLTSVHDENKVT